MGVKQMHVALPCNNDCLGMHELFLIIITLLEILGFFVVFFEDKVIVGSYHGYVRIYQPMSATKADNENSGNNPDDVVCEIQLSLPILQLEAGRFVS